MKKVLIVGCGAIGSLFAAHLAKARRGRGVCLRRLAAAHGRHQPARPAAFGRCRHARASWRRPAPIRPSFRSATTASSRPRQFTPRRHRGGGPLLRRQQRRVLGAERRRQRRDHRRAREVRDSRHNLPCRAHRRARARGFRHQGRHLDRAVRADGHADGRGSRSWPATSRAAA